MPPSIDFQPSIRVSQFGGRSQRQLVGVSSSPLVQDHVAAVAMRAKLETRKAKPRSTVRLLDPAPVTLASAAPRTALLPAASAAVASALNVSSEAASTSASANGQTASAFSAAPPEHVALRKPSSANPPPLAIPQPASLPSAPITPRTTAAVQPPHTPGSSAAARSSAIAPITAESDLVAAPLEVAARWSREEWLLVVRAVEAGGMRCLKCPKQPVAMAAATHGAIHLVQSLKSTSAPQRQAWARPPIQAPQKARGHSQALWLPRQARRRADRTCFPSGRLLFYTTSSGIVR
ncbi:hypothetical protein CLOP_g16326 [Closterium sp. NIES-67]|nr:hypothetical protein CLOP_g16326 [Closterium sp. NIES-67]